MLLHIKGVPNTKNRRSDNMWLATKIIRLSTKPKHFPAVKTNSDIHFYCRAAHKILANVVIQIAQPQVCYPNPKQDTLDMTSSMY